MKALALILAAALLLGACSQPATTGATPSTPQTVPALNGTPEPPKTGADGAVEREFAVTMREYGIDPGTITATEGEAVVLTITNEGQAAHGFGLLEFGVNERIEPGETKVVRFVADKKGTYRIFCSVPCGSGHRLMQATLVVE